MRAPKVTSIDARRARQVASGYALCALPRASINQSNRKAWEQGCTYTYPQPMAITSASTPGSRFRRYGGSLLLRRGHALEAYRQQHPFEPVVTALTQRVFPPLLRTAFQEERLPPAVMARLYRMVRSGQLVLVENDLLVAINLRIDDAIREVEPATVTPVPPLVTKEDVRPKAVQWSPPSMPGGQRVAATEMKRIAVVSAFTFGTWAAVDAFDFRRNACASQQEREFLRAVRQFFPSLQAYPNMPLKNFIDIDKLEATVPARVRQYAWLAQVDVLLCTADEDPVAGIELDSMHHDTEEAAERDEL